MFTKKEGKIENLNVKIAGFMSVMNELRILY